MASRRTQARHPKEQRAPYKRGWSLSGALPHTAPRAPTHSPGCTLLLGCERALAQLSSPLASRQACSTALPAEHCHSLLSLHCHISKTFREEKPPQTASHSGCLEKRELSFKFKKKPLFNILQERSSCLTSNAVLGGAPKVAAVMISKPTHPDEQCLPHLTSCT